jgi:hypothetical protein
MTVRSSDVDPMPTKPTLPLLRRCKAAEYIRENWGIPCEPRTLAKLMTVGGGPLVRKAGRIPLYEKSDLDAWASARLSAKVRSSSELQSARMTVPPATEHARAVERGVQ